MNCKMNLAQKCLLFFKITIVILLCLPQLNAQLEEWKIPCGADYKPENCEDASPETLATVEDFERCAPALLDTLSREYVWNGAGQEKTFFENKAAYKKMWIKKSVLYDLNDHSLEISVFGRKVGIPIGISPTAGHAIYHPDGDIGTARAVARAGAVLILDVYANTTMEDVAAAVPEGTEKWMHTYMFERKELVEGVVRRAEEAGFKAIVVTVDQPTDFDIRCGTKEVFFDERVQLKPNIRPEFPNDTDHGRMVVLEDVKWLVGITKLPVIAKGIQTGKDAVRVIEVGVKGVIVSNQGGRQLDDGLPTIDSLPEVVEAVKSQYPDVDVFVDGGVRSGHDVFKALARGAKMAFIGRPAIWGLTMGGEKGVSKVLTILRNEFEDAMIRAGFSNPSLITPSSIVSEWKYSDYPLKKL